MPVLLPCVRLSQEHKQKKAETADLLRKSKTCSKDVPEKNLNGDDLCHDGNEYLGRYVMYIGSQNADGAVGLAV